MLDALHVAAAKDHFLAGLLVRYRTAQVDRGARRLESHRDATCRQILRRHVIENGALERLLLCTQAFVGAIRHWRCGCGGGGGGRGRRRCHVRAAMQHLFTRFLQKRYQAHFYSPG